MASEKLLIDSTALVVEITKAQDSLKSNNDALWRMNQKYYKGLAWAHRLVLDAPTVDAVEVVHARWELRLYDALFVDHICSACGHTERLDIQLSPLEWKFCPNCGAKMDGGNEDG